MGMLISDYGEGNNLKIRKRNRVPPFHYDILPKINTLFCRVTLIKNLNLVRAVNSSHLN